MDINITCSMTADNMAKLAWVSEKNSSSSEETGNLCKTNNIAKNSEPLPPAKRDETLPYALFLFIGKCMEMIV